MKLDFSEGVIRSDLRDKYAIGNGYGKEIAEMILVDDHLSDSKRKKPLYEKPSNSKKAPPPAPIDREL